MKVKVDKEKCIGCGACVAICSAVFELDKEGKSSVKKPECDDDCCKQAAEHCPVDAITL